MIKNYSYALLKWPAKLLNIFLAGNDFWLNFAAN